MDTFRIETPRLILREFVPEDLAGLYRLYEESDTRYIEPLAKDPEEELEKLKSYIHYIYGFYGFGLWAVCLKESGELIGRCGLQVELIGDEGEYELGYMVSGKYTGCGYASEA
ncbi:MAG: GNAT family N-acetyltransferase, partial [Frisingicoccus sp.]|nr:GNAT family N-acetyltransferase [Frisingicoccus sp.]